MGPATHDDRGWTKMHVHTKVPFKAPEPLKRVAAPARSTTADERRTKPHRPSQSRRTVDDSRTNRGRRRGRSGSSTCAAGRLPVLSSFCSNSERHRHRCLALRSYSSLRSQSPCGRASLPWPQERVAWPYAIC